MRRLRDNLLILIGTVFALGSCEKTRVATERTPLRAEAPKTAECAACGMVVREQPAPRGQLIHRDGTRKFFCSVGDLLQYLRAPSAHGKPKAIFVEALDPKADPKATSITPRPWIRAQEATFITGVPRPGVMGKPVLVYRERAVADRIRAGKKGSALLDFHRLRTAPQN